MEKLSLFCLSILMLLSSNLVASTNQNNCPKNLSRFLKIQQSLTSRTTENNPLLKIEYFYDNFPVDDHAIATSNPDIFKLAIQLINVKQWSHLEMSLQEIEYLTLSEFINNLQFQIQQLEIQLLRKLQKLNSTKVLFLIKKLRKHRTNDFFREFKEQNQNNFNQPIAGFSLEERKKLYLKIKNLTDRIASFGSELTIAMTKDANAKINIPIKINPSSAKIIELDDYTYSPIDSHLIKEIDLLIPDVGTIAEIKYHQGPINLKLARWNKIIGQLQEYLLINKLYYFPAIQGKRTELKITQYEFYAINGIEKTAAQVIESLGFKVLGPRF